MKARKCCRLNPHTEGYPGFNGAAPMKARKCEQRCYELCDHVLLQWSRADEGAEIGGSPVAPNALGELQWSRADEGAEIGLPQLATRRDLRFNGAAPMKARKWYSLLRRMTPVRASMEPRR